MFLTENLATTILFVSYIFAMLVEETEELESVESDDKTTVESRVETREVEC